MKIGQTLLNQMIEHAEEDAPNECCGLVSGNDGEARVVRDRYLQLNRDAQRQLVDFVETL